MGGGNCTLCQGITTSISPSKVMRNATCNTSCDALSAKALSLPLSTCAKNKLLLSGAALVLCQAHSKRQENYQERHSLPLLLLYPVCQPPCHWLEIEVCQQLICVVVPHHLDTWLTSTQGIYLHRRKVQLQHSRHVDCSQNHQIMAVEDVGRPAWVVCRGGLPETELSLRKALR